VRRTSLLRCSALIVAALAAGAALAVSWGAPSVGAQELPPPQADPAQVREQADDILSQAEYEGAKPTVIDRIRTWIADRVQSVLQRGTEQAAGTPLFGYAILAAGLAGIVYLLYRWLRRVQADPTVEAAEAEPAEHSFHPGDWRAAAERFEAEGEWKEALRCRYRVLVSELVDREVVGDVPGRTAGEYRREVADGFPAAAPPFDDASDLFELAWYADAPTGPEENRRIRTLTDDVVELVG
jgi:hypothetical protein